MAMRARRFEAERGLDPCQQGGIRPLGNADAAIPLHIGMTAQRADAGARLSEIAAQQQQIGDLLNIGSALCVLCDSHAVADDGGVRLGIRRGDGFQRITRQSAGRLDR